MGPIDEMRRRAVFYLASAMLVALIAVPSLAAGTGDSQGGGSAGAPPAQQADGHASQGADDAAKPTQSTHSSSRKSAKGKHSREKEAEGTEAPDRFQADTVIKSKYELNGEPLEVDPD